MSDVTARFERLIDRINVVYGLIVPVGLMTIVAILLWIFDPSYFQPDSFPSYVLIIAMVVVVFSVHYITTKNLQHNPFRLLYLFYHIALIGFCYFVAPFMSPFDFLWVVLGIGMDLLFGRRWIILTILLYFITLIGVFFRTDQILNAHSILSILVQISGIAGTTLLVSRYRQVSDDERDLLDKTSQISALERQRLLSLINNMGEAVVATDEKGKIMLYNAAVLNLLDTNQTLDNKRLDSILKLYNEKGRRIKLFDLVKKSAVGFSSSDFLHAFDPNDSINLYINVSPVKLGFKENSDRGYIVLMRDITKEKSLEEERDEFISVVSHELRTPVAIAEGNIGNAMFVSEKSSKAKDILPALEQAHDQVVFLASMINDLATLSRAERTDVKMELEEVNLKQLITELGEVYLGDAKAKGLKLTATIAKNVTTIFTSELYLREILQNFITNAIKYTKNGTILVHVRMNKVGDAVFSVADTGIGLSKTDQKRVFEKFFRSEDYRTRESSGTGLGLYVTAKLAHRINARIDLESVLNKGSTFTITVPSFDKKNKG